MATTINADDGAISGSAGLKYSSDSTGVLALQTNGTTAVSVSTAQVVTLTNALPVASGGTGLTTATGVLVGAGSSVSAVAAGTNGNLLTSNGTTWTSAAAPSGMVYPGAGIPNSTGSAWGTSYSTTGTGTVVALATSPNFTSPVLGTPTSGNLANCTFPTLNQNTTGSAATVTGNATGSTFGFNSGYGSVATAYGCRAWVNFNGQGTVSIRGSANVSSITDNGTADYTVNFTTSLPDGNYAFSGMSRDTGGGGAMAYLRSGTLPAAGSVRINTLTSGNSGVDSEYVAISVFR
jgi:hypothetical protein